MVHYSGVSIVDFEQVNIGWDLSGSFQKLESRKNLEKSHAWPFKRLSPTRKIFKGDHWILPKLKQLVTQTNHNKSLIFLMADIAYDTQLKQDLQIYTKFLSSSSYSCLPMKVCESEVYKHIVQPLDTHCSCFFWRNLSLDTLAVTKIYTKFLKVKIRFSHITIIWQKDFIIHQVHKKSSYNHLK